MNVDVLSTYQLHNYEDILQEINSAFEKSKLLKREIQQTENTITTMKLGLSSCQKHISHVNVKIFNNLMEISNLYYCDFDYTDISRLNTPKNYVFFLVEVIITKTLLEKLLDSLSTWKFNIIVRTLENLSYSKVVSLDKKNSTLVVLPVSSDIYECTVDTLLLCLFGEHVNAIDLYSVNVDISFYFESCKQSSTISLEQEFFNLAKLYKCINFTDTNSSRQVIYQMRYNSKENKFVPTFIKNSYHKLNLELFTEFLNETRKIVDFYFSINNKKLNVLYNKDNHVLKMKCPPMEMMLLKKFFLKYSLITYREFNHKLQVLKKEEVYLSEMDLNKLLSLYQELRKIWI